MKYPRNNYKRLNSPNYRTFVVANIQNDDRQLLLNKLKLSSNETARLYATILEDSGTNFTLCKKLATKYNRSYASIKYLINKWNRDYNSFRKYL